MNQKPILRANSMAQVWTIKQILPIYHPKAAALPLQRQWVCRGAEHLPLKRVPLGALKLKVKPLHSVIQPSTPRTKVNEGGKHRETQSTCHGCHRLSLQIDSRGHHTTLLSQNINLDQ